MSAKLKEYINVMRTKKLKARENLEAYMHIIKDDYKPAWFHKVICSRLTEFAKDEEARYEMLFMPPQNGKSLHSTLGLATFMLGLNPKLKIAVISYNSDTASFFGSEISKILKSAPYKSIFPDTTTGVKGLSDNKKIVETTAGGYIISVGVGGGLTSKTVDVFIFDDLYKGPSDAWSSVYRERVWDHYNTVAGTRGHKKEKMLILYTRWHEDDLAGRLLDKYPAKWGKILFQGIKTKEFEHPDDPREPGEILWPARHSLEKYTELRELDEIAFEALIQQNPTPRKGLMYPTHKTWESLDNVRGVRKAYVDSADSGEDHLAAVFYIEDREYCYITDIYYTKDDMDVTYKELARRVLINETQKVKIESNNGGRFFSTQVEKEYKKIGGRVGRFETFHQGDNKQARIFSNSASVCNYILFPHDWKNKHKEAYMSFTKYRREGKNAFDDLQDAVTGVAENNKLINRINNKFNVKKPRGL